MFNFLIVGLIILASSEAAKSDTEPYLPLNDTRIIGGTKISIQKVPCQVALIYKNDLHCGGSVLSRRLILSAAHCVYKYQASNFQVRAGSNSWQKGGQLRTVSKIVYDSSYNPKNQNNDIAILKLSQPLVLNQLVKPVTLSFRTQPKSRNALVSGWGLAKENAENVQKYLRGVQVRFIDFNKCQHDYKNVAKITKNMVCAGAINGGKDACQGDSGGGLTQNCEIYGITSFGQGCGRPNFPGVYTSIAAKKRWVMNTARNI